MRTQSEVLVIEEVTLETVFHKLIQSYSRKGHFLVFSRHNYSIYYLRTIPIELNCLLIILCSLKLDINKETTFSNWFIVSSSIEIYSKGALFKHHDEEKHKLDGQSIYIVSETYFRKIPNLFPKFLSFLGTTSHFRPIRDCYSPIIICLTFVTIWLRLSF